MNVANVVLDGEVIDSAIKEDDSARSADQATATVAASEIQAARIEAPGAGTETDPFDPARLRLSQDFAATLGVKKMLLTVPVKKPSKEWWIRVHPEESYRIQTAVLELKEDREIFLVDPSLWPELATESTFGRGRCLRRLIGRACCFSGRSACPGRTGRSMIGTGRRSRRQQWPRGNGFVSRRTWILERTTC